MQDNPTILEGRIDDVLAAILFVESHRDELHFESEPRSL